MYESTSVRVRTNMAYLLREQILSAAARNAATTKRALAPCGDMVKRNYLFCAKAKLIYLLTFILACTSNLKATPPYAPTVPSADILSRCGCKLDFDPKCTRVLEFERAPKGGVGHQLSELVFALQLASFQNAALKMKPFDDVISTDSGDSYRFLNSLLGLDFLWRNSQVNTSQLRRVPFSFSDSDPGQCDLIFHGRYRDCKGGGKMGCFNSPLFCCQWDGGRKQRSSCERNCSRRRG